MAPAAYGRRSVNDETASATVVSIAAITSPEAPTWGRISRWPRAQSKGLSAIIDRVRKINSCGSQRMNVLTVKNPNHRATT